ncbi:hypothetical protein HU175_15860 [Spirosoma sp. KUDC1026]|nr:hypothetical protein HU175_15860 [Spirosoma sp. KUDC1026]
MVWALNATAVPDPVWPQLSLSNGVLQTTLYLPNAEQGYYRGTRFDWSGAFKSLTYNGHRFVDQWFDQYDPRLHDAINGPAEEFTPLGYDEAAIGDTFVKIGVGVLRRADEKPYAFGRYYDIMDGGSRTLQFRKDRIDFLHELRHPSGYGYQYQKTVRLLPGKPVLVLEHRLKNTGQKPIQTSVYNHNFWVLDQEPTGPGIDVSFPFAVQGQGKGFGGLLQTQGNRLVYTRPFAPKETVYSAGLQGFSAMTSDYDIRITNQKTGAGVHITGDQPLQKLVYWACATTSCPEPYVLIEVAPGAEKTWTVQYEFSGEAR